MSQWRLKLIGDVCEVNPRLPRGHGISDEQIVSFVPMAAVDEVVGTIQHRQSRPFAAVKKGYTHFKNGDVLFAKITPCMENGKAAIASDLAGGLGFGSTEFHILRAKDEVLPEWLFYFVRQPAFRSEAKRNFTGTAGQQRVPTTFLSSAAIPVPPLPEQRRIVDLLSRAEGIVRLRREAEKKAAELIPALFLDMFGDPATNPKGWAVAKVGDVLEMAIRNGISPSRTGLHLGKVLTLSAITRGGFDPCAVKVSTFAAPLHPDDEVCSRDFLVCRGNGNPHLVGRGCFPSEDLPGVVFPDTAIALRPSANRLHRHFFEAAWNTAHVRQQIRSSAKTTNGTYKINQAGVAGISIPAPPLVLQVEFGDCVAGIRAIQSQQSAATAKAQATFSALLANAFTAETQ